MSLTVKYEDVLRLAGDLKMEQSEIREEDGQLKIWGTVPYKWDKQQFWNALNQIDGYQTEVVADIRFAHEEPYGMYEVQKGDTLSHIAQAIYGEKSAWRAIAKYNEDDLPDPDRIRPGMQLRLPDPSNVG
jgi:nucleoid-associated protein YgaU